MKKQKLFLIKTVYTLFLISTISIVSCDTKTHKFPLDKQYWDVNDYDKAILELRFSYKNDETKPTFDNPKQRLIVEKLTNHENYNVILDDSELGIKHKNKIASEFFAHWKDMGYIYEVTDEKDKYLYGKEMLAVWHFGLDLQLKYFKLGNDEILESSDDPEAEKVQELIESNVENLLDNYANYLSLINNENSFYEKEKDFYATGINTYFTKLVNMYPDADYSPIVKKINLMLKKTKTATIKASLEKLIHLIESKKEDA